MNKMRHLHCPFCLAKSKGEKVEEGHYYWKCWNGHEFTTRVPSRGVRGGAIGNDDEKVSEHSQ